MFFTDSVFVGIDPTSGRRAFCYAALDKELNLLALADGEGEDVTAFLAGQQSAVVAMNAPRKLNRGLIRERMKKAMLTPHQIRGAEMRLAEFELRERGIAVSGTPGSMASCPGWMQLGFEMYRKMDQLGFKDYPETHTSHQILETHPHACFCVLAGSSPMPKPSLEGRLQRQLLLYEHGIKIRDPMDFFEEITRYKLSRGIWPVEMLYPSEQLDALVAAYTAWMAIHKPDKVLLIGEKTEGEIVLPVEALKERY